MFQNLTRLSGQLVPEQFTDSSFNSAAARLLQPGLIMVTDEPDEKLPTSGIGRTETTTTTTAPTFGDSGLTTHAAVPVAHDTESPQSAVVHFPRLEPAYVAPEVPRYYIMGAASRYREIQRNAVNPIAASVEYLEEDTNDDKSFAAWWQLMDILVQAAGAPETDGKTNDKLKQKTHMLVLAAHSAKLPAMIPGFLDFLAQQHTALTQGEITNRYQHTLLFALVWEIGKNAAFPASQYKTLFEILLWHGLAATGDKDAAGWRIAQALLEIVTVRPDVPVAARLDIMQRYHDAGFWDIDLMEGVSTPLQRW